jgi:hypothetical protein
MTIVGTPSSVPFAPPRLRLSLSGASLAEEEEDERSASGSARLIARVSLESSSELRLNSCQNERGATPMRANQPLLHPVEICFENRRKVEDRRECSAIRQRRCGMTRQARALNER